MKTINDLQGVKDVYVDMSALINRPELLDEFETIYINVDTIGGLGDEYAKPDTSVERKRRIWRISQRLSNRKNVIVMASRASIPPNVTVLSGDLDIVVWALLRKTQIEYVYVPWGDQRLEYNGCKFIADPSEDDLSNYYSHPEINSFGCRVGEYVVLDGDKQTVGKWDGSRYVNIKPVKFRSEALGEIKPRDAFQRCACDSLVNNHITILTGLSGSGKTLLALSYIMDQLQSGKLSRCHIIHHYEKLKYSKELGYMKGTLEDKLLTTGALGNILASKFGSKDVILPMLREGVLNILPTNAIRGFEAGASEAVYCTEAQDMDAYSVRTILHRCSDSSKVILEGDIDEQVDIPRESGLGKAVMVLRGHEGFGYVKLQTCYRTKFGELFDKIK